MGWRQDGFGAMGASLPALAALAGVAVCMATATLVTAGFVFNLGRPFAQGQEIRAVLCLTQTNIPVPVWREWFRGKYPVEEK